MSSEDNRNNYTARILPRINDVSEVDWDSLVPPGHPFLSWRFLNALEESGCVSAETGWAPRHIWIENAKGEPIGAAPLYAKGHSRGEYVFDHGWADALHRAGGEYYPKLQCAVPFTPVNGPRLLAPEGDAKQALISAMVQVCQEWDCSGVHLTFLDAGDQKALETAGFLMRTDRQFHFINRGYDNFGDFLASLSSRKRKNIKKERLAAQDGITIKRLTGADLKSEHWDVFYECYLDTGARKWGAPLFEPGIF